MASSRPSSPFPPDAPWDDMPDAGPRPRRSWWSVRDALVFMAGAIVGQALLTLYVVWMLS